MRVPSSGKDKNPVTCALAGVCICSGVKHSGECRTTTNKIFNVSRLGCGVDGEVTCDVWPYRKTRAQLKHSIGFKGRWAHHSWSYYFTASHTRLFQCQRQFSPQIYFCSD